MTTAMKIKNKAGELITLDKREARVVNMNQRIVNALGVEVNITTLTTIMKKISEQKFFRIAPADYVPVRVGEGAWSSNLLTYRSFNLSDDFATGIINTGGNNARLASGDAGVDSLSIKVINWAKSIGWSLFDLELAAKSGNWDLVTAKEKSRKENWDLGIQKIAFLGVQGDPNIAGLFTQPSVSVDTTVLSAPINSLVATPAQLNVFVTTVLNNYRSQCQRTAWPSALIVPESDYIGLATPSSPTFPLKSVLQVLQETFQTMTQNPNFKIMPCAYGDRVYSGLTKQMYCLINQDEESIRMDIPVDYTNTLANSIDNFSFQNVGYGQFTGVLAYRPLELYYFGF